jgi:pimeloyl-ACP methyl ester carboxylesterase
VLLSRLGAHGEQVRDHHATSLVERLYRSVQQRLLNGGVALGVLVQMHQWLRNQKFLSSDGTINYAPDLKKLKVPILLITGSRDPFTPHHKVKRAFRSIGSKKKEWMVFGKKYGHITNYGHLDLIIGRNASKEVYPSILNWLKQNDR